jgi:O-acetyl-ADP-ribose deacetylase (regulator of RNase III)
MINTIFSLKNRKMADADAEEAERTAAPVQAYKKRRFERGDDVEDSAEDEGAFSLAFPSFGTGVFQFDIQRAAKVACEVIIISFIIYHLSFILIYYISSASSCVSGEA